MALTFVVQITEKTEAFMENSRRLANTAARLEQNKEEVARQVNKASASSISVMHFFTFLSQYTSQGGGGGVFATCSITSVNKPDLDGQQ